MKKPLRNYHGRRFAVSGAIAILKANASYLDPQIAIAVAVIDERFKDANWAQYQKEKQQP